MESEEKRKRTKRRIIIFVVIAFVIGFAIGFGVWWKFDEAWRYMEHEWDYREYYQLYTLIR